MIDFGKLPRTVISSITRVCAFADVFVENTKNAIWADRAPQKDLPQWERFLNIFYDRQISTAYRRYVILGYLNANGFPRVDWFYLLAERLNFARGHFDIYENVWGFPHPYYGSAVYFTDGDFLPFRTDISKSGSGTGSGYFGDKVYDNIDFGATTCVCYYRKGNAETDLREQLVDLISAARNVGTKILFIDTDYLIGQPGDGEDYWNWVENLNIIRTAG